MPRPPQPVILHEEEASLWRKRADLTISLRVTDTLLRTDRRYRITSPPAVTLKSRCGQGLIDSECAVPYNESTRNLEELKT